MVLARTELTVVGNTLYFVTDSNNDYKQELWKIDSNGVGRVKNDLNAAPNLGFCPINLTAVGNTLYFTTYDSATGLELWKSDGTNTGTVLVKDIWSGADPNNSIPYSLVNFNGTLYFVASEPTNGREVWSSDGTALGTRRVSNINSGSSDANPAECDCRWYATVFYSQQRDKWNRIVGFIKGGDVYRL